MMMRRRTTREASRQASRSRVSAQAAERVSPLWDMKLIEGVEGGTVGYDNGRGGVLEL
jgi:hypothetical protein